MEYISVKEASQRWGITTRRVQMLCNRKRIEGAMRIGNMWIIPAQATKPPDGRYKKDQ